MKEHLTPKAALPADGTAGTLIGRAWVPGDVAGPSPVVIRDGGVFDLATVVPTVSELLNADDPVALARREGSRIGDLAMILANSAHDRRDPALPHFLAPCDLQAVKASGVTFATSLLERVIEEQARGDAGRAQAIRATITDVIGTDLSKIEPGSAAAERLKEHLLAQNAWSQYLEVGIGPYAEIFTKCPPMAAVGTGSEIGIHSESSWNNPEPELVLAINARGEIVGATLGNDVNLRDVEGRSALLLGKAKDNNASCALGPFIRLLDDTLPWTGSARPRSRSGSAVAMASSSQGSSSMAEISRDITDLVGHTMGAHHQYPDGAMLMCGTMFAPIQDRGQPGQGFTHALGDLVTIACPELGTLANQVNQCDRVPPWTFGTAALMRNLAARGLL